MKKTRSLFAPWLILGISCLAASGLLSLVLGTARMPWLASYFKDPLSIRRILVVHVNLGFTVWFSAFPVVLFHWVNKDAVLSARKRLQNQLGLWVSVLGLALLFFGGLFGGGDPILSNYVPVVANPYFLWGLAFFYGGCALSLAEPDLFKTTRMESQAKSTTLSEELKPALRSGVLFYLMSVGFLVYGYLYSEKTDSINSFFEEAMWGGGHLFQFVNVIFLIISWSILLSRFYKKNLVSQRIYRIVFSWLCIPLLLVPVLLAHSPHEVFYREAFTQMMRWGIFPPVLFFLGAVMIGIRQFHQLEPNASVSIEQKSSLTENQDLHLKTTLNDSALGTSWKLSTFLLISGFVFGFLIRSYDLRVPGHYHASIGAVSLAYTVTSFVFAIESLWFRSPQFWNLRLTKIFVWTYGFGQWIFGFGMVVAGFYGMTRKVYGVEQVITHPMQKVGMGIMGLGGVTAALGGILFFVILIRGWTQNLKFRSQKKGGEAPIKASPNCLAEG